MTGPKMDLRAVVEKSAERLAQRKGYRDRDWQTRAGSVELRIPRRFITLIKQANSVLPAVRRDSGSGPFWSR